MLPNFQTYGDIEAWLKPMGYGTFMDTMIGIGLFGPEDRAHCDRSLEDGITDMQTACAVMKFIAAAELKEQLNVPFLHEVMDAQGNIVLPPR